MNKAVENDSNDVKIYLGTQTDLKGLSSLFNACFNQPFVPELWCWKYGPDQTFAVTAAKNGIIIGHYAGVPRKILFNDQILHMLQITDVMVHPQNRAAHGRRGVFFQMASRFLEKYVGYEKPFLQSFGFPNERHTRLGVLLGFYDRVGQVFDVRWPPLTTFSTTWHKSREIREKRAISNSLQRLWPAMNSSLKGYLVGIRDAAYIIHRYLNHPIYQYGIYEVYNRLTRRVNGLFILRFHEDGTCELMDLIANIKDMPMLTKFARHEVFKQGATCLFSWMSEAMVANLAADATITDIQVTVPCITWTPCPKPEELRGKWWLMSGDTDWR